MQNQFGWTCYLRIKTNQTHLFILLDFITDQSYGDSDDYTGICFDTKNDGGNFPKVDDYSFLIRHWGSSISKGGNNFICYQGKGTGGEQPWGQISMTSGVLMAGDFTASNDPYELGRDHGVYEFQIPVSFLGKGYFYGFYAYVYDYETKNFLEWPPNAGGKEPEWTVQWYNTPAPGNWGDITSSTQFDPDAIPEFPNWLILPLLMGTLLLTTVIYKKRWAGQRLK